MYQPKEKIELDKLELHTPQHGDYYLSAEYTRTTKTAKSKITIPKILLPVRKDKLSTSSKSFTADDFVYESRNTVNLGFGELYLDNQFKITEEIIEEFLVEMTIADIERELGHKIKIVSGEKEK